MDVGYKPRVPSLTSHFIAEMSATIHLCRGDRVLEISLRRYAAQQLARMFNVEQDTIWLQSRYKDGYVYFRNPDGVFDLLNDGVLPHAELIVEAEPSQGQASQPSCSSIYVQPSLHLSWTISRNARSKGIDNCCGLYIRVYFRITPIENERCFINLIAI